MQSRMFEKLGGVCAGLAGIAGFAVAIASFLVLRGAPLPRALAYLGFVAAALLVSVYVGRLVILNPHDAALHTAAVISGFVVDPAWFVWLGWALWRGAGQEQLVAQPA
jgi:hypothetical protein